MSFFPILFWEIPCQVIHPVVTPVFEFSYDVDFAIISRAQEGFSVACKNFAGSQLLEVHFATFSSESLSLLHFASCFANCKAVNR